MIGRPVPCCFSRCFWAVSARSGRSSICIGSCKLTAGPERLPWHVLYFLPLPQGQGSFRPGFCILGENAWAKRFEKRVSIYKATISATAPGTAMLMSSGNHFLFDKPSGRFHHVRCATSATSTELVSPQLFAGNIRIFKHFGNLRRLLVSIVYGRRQFRTSISSTGVKVDACVNSFCRDMAVKRSVRQADPRPLQKVRRGLTKKKVMM